MRHDVLLCIGLGKDRATPTACGTIAASISRTIRRIAAKFPERPDVLTQTLGIADTAGIEFGKKYHVPSFPLPTACRDGKRSAR
jgi:DNA polymerase-3 subunit alpha